MFKKRWFLYGVLVILAGLFTYFYWYFPPFQGKPATLDQLRSEYNSANIALHRLPQVERESCCPAGTVSRDDKLAALRDRLINAKVNNLPSNSVEMRSLNTRLMDYTEICCKQAKLIRATKRKIRKNLNEARKLRIGIWTYLAHLEHIRDPKLARALSLVALAKSDKEEDKALGPIYSRILDDDTSYITEGARSDLSDSLDRVEAAWDILNEHQYSENNSHDGPPDYNKAVEIAEESLQYAKSAQQKMAINTLSRQEAMQWLDAKRKHKLKAAELLSK